MPKVFHLFSNECHNTHEEGLIISFFKDFFSNKYCIVDQLQSTLQKLCIRNNAWFIYAYKVEE